MLGSRAGRFNPRTERSAHIEEEAVWELELVWKVWRRIKLLFMFRIEPRSPSCAVSSTASAPSGLTENYICFNTKYIVCIYLYIRTVNKHNNISNRSDM